MFLKFFGENKSPVFETGLFIDKGQNGKPTSFADAILHQHNYYREIAGIPLMKWNDAVARNAQRWASHLHRTLNCRMQHSRHSFRTNIGGFSYLGENLYWAWSSASVSVNAQRARKAVTSWYSEIADFQYSKRGVVCPKRGNRGMIGHFTQVMWDKSTSLGCGYAVCGGKSLVIVCQYAPGGNFNMQSNPPFSLEAAKRLDKHPINKQYGGLPSCD